MPISKDEFRSIDEDGPSLHDLAPDTTQGGVYRFLLDHADQASRQQEIVDGVDVPERSVGPTLKCLEEHDLVEHRGRFWTIADAEYAVGSAGLHSAAIASPVSVSSGSPTGSGPRRHLRTRRYTIRSSLTAFATTAW
jgi:hypothetical protein